MRGISHQIHLISLSTPPGCASQREIMEANDYCEGGEKIPTSPRAHETSNASSRCAHSSASSFLVVTSERECDGY
jgi:hypothetical protein